jgi:small subunit ribosomal protein S15
MAFVDIIFPIFAARLVAMQLTKESKKEIFTRFGGNEANTGSTEAQVALFTERINHISQHLKGNRKDYSAELSLVKLVGKRRSLLNYLAKQDIFKYRALIKELGIRK